MPRAGFGAIVIYDEKMYQGRGHVVYDWGKRIERNFVRWAKEEAPVRSGQLREQITGNMVRTGVRHLTTTITSGAPHSMYVIAGTTGPIMSNRMWAFRGRTGLHAPRGGVFGSPLNPRGFDIPFLAKNYYTLNVRAGKGFPQRNMIEVRGQSPNNFMGRAGEHVGRRHSSLRGFSPGVTFWRQG